MHLPREVMLSQRRVKSKELWEQEKDSGSFDRITVFIQQVFVTQVPQPLKASEAWAIISSDWNIVNSLFEPMEKKKKKNTW